jgi:hypothetical protein
MFLKDNQCRAAQPQEKDYRLRRESNRLGADSEA